MPCLQPQKPLPTATPPPAIQNRFLLKDPNQEAPRQLSGSLIRGGGDGGWERDRREPPAAARTSWSLGPPGYPWEREGTWALGQSFHPHPPASERNRFLLPPLSRCSGFYVTTCKFNDIFPGWAGGGEVQSAASSCCQPTRWEEPIYAPFYRFKN